MNWQQQAEELFGDHWKANVAHLAGVSKRAVQYWVSGERQTPDTVSELIEDLYETYKAYF